MKKPTKKQINQQIAALKKMKPRVLRYSGFGDDHHAAIDAQIHVLKERLSTDDVYTKADDCAMMECCGDDNINWQYENVESAGLEAAKWLVGESDDHLLTDGWKPLMDRDPAKILRPSKSILR